MAENKYTVEDLKKMQSWSLERKVRVTQTRIIEWYQKHNGQVYVSFSGGKDSTVLLDLTRRIYPGIEAVFIDTGLEYPEIREFVKTVSNVTWIKPEMNFRKVIETYGYPIISKEVSQTIYYARKNIAEGKRTARTDKMYGVGHITANGKSRFDHSNYQYLLDTDFLISDRCCDVMKKRPAKKYSSETGKKPIIATMACESELRKTQWLRRGCNSFESKNPKSSPMSFWTEQDVLEYIKTVKVPYCSIYGEIIGERPNFKTTGCSRTGCVFCGFGCHLEKEPNRFQRLQETHPKLYDYCMRDWDRGGLGMKKVLETIGVPTESGDADD